MSMNNTCQYDVANKETGASKHREVAVVCDAAPAAEKNNVHIVKTEAKTIDCWSRPVAQNRAWQRQLLCS